MLYFYCLLVPRLLRPLSLERGGDGKIMCEDISVRLGLLEFLDEREILLQITNINEKFVGKEYAVCC